MILFLPLGAAIGWCGWRRGWSALAPALLSLAVETAQLWIPGRDASLGDVVFNSTGAVLGFAVARSAGWWLRPGRATRRLLMLGALAGVIAVFGATGVLFQPDLPRTVYWGQWTAQLGRFEWYRGRVVRAAVGGVELPDGRLANSDSVRTLLLARAPLVIDARAGPPVSGLAPLFSIADGGAREIVLLGPDRSGLVVRYRTRAVAAWLANPALRADGALAGIEPGQPLNVTLRADGHGWCLVVDGRAHCGLGFTLGRGWAMIDFPAPLPTWFRASLDELWLACLLLPLGFWLTGRRAGAAAVIAAGAGLWLVPASLGLMPTPPAEWAAAAAGLALGLALRRNAEAPAPPK